MNFTVHHLFTVAFYSSLPSQGMSECAVSLFGHFPLKALILVPPPLYLDYSALPLPSPALLVFAQRRLWSQAASGRGETMGGLLSVEGEYSQLHLIWSVDTMGSGEDFVSFTRVSVMLV